MAVMLLASQPSLQKNLSDATVVDGFKATTTLEAAAALLQALNSPVCLEWMVELGNGCTASISAELSHELPWPPDKVMVRTQSSPTASASMLVKGTVTPEQLASVLDGGIAAAREIQQPAATENYEVMTSADLEPNLRSMHLIDSDPGRLILQPLSLQQWHHGACGHHALFSIRCFLQGRLQSLRDEQHFWQEVMVSIDSLSSYGESSRRWPKSRVTSGIVDELHADYLVNSSSVLRGRVSVVPSYEALEAQLSRPSSPERKALQDVRAGLQRAHGFLLGASTHWYAAVAIAGTDRGQPRLVFLDSHNVPLAKLRNARDAEDLANKEMLKIRDAMYRDLQSSNLWKHRPQEHLDRAFVDGVEEWWKGILKASPFWKHPPSHVRSQLKVQELDAVRCYLEALSSVLQSESGESERRAPPSCAL